MISNATPIPYIRTRFFLSCAYTWMADMQRFFIPFYVNVTRIRIEERLTITTKRCLQAFFLFYQNFVLGKSLFPLTQGRCNIQAPSFPFPCLPGYPFYRPARIKRTRSLADYAPTTYFRIETRLRGIIAKRALTTPYWTLRNIRIYRIMAIGTFLQFIERKNARGMLLRVYL